MQPTTPGGTVYNVGTYPAWHKFHRDLPTTFVLAYGNSLAGATFPGPTFITRRGVPITVNYTNNFVGNDGNPITPPWVADQTIMDPQLRTLPMFDPILGPQPYNGPIAISPHLHGGEVEPGSDGGPRAWFTPGFAKKGPSWRKAAYRYTNEQPATTLWYHDHAMGMTRLNAYWGLAGYYLITDPANEPANLPTGAYDVPLCIQDKQFTTDGQLVYPAIGINPQHPFWMPEAFGDIICVNGTIWPYLNVEPRKYRFRLLNGSDSRFYTLRLSSGQPFQVIADDGGYLAAPALVNQLTIGPGERYSVVVNFRNAAVGSQILLTNDAQTPWPAGGLVDPLTTGRVMAFNVVALTGPDTSRVPAVLNTIPALGPATVTRTLTLNEVTGPGGPLTVLFNGREFMAPVDINPKVGTTEIWQIVNLTGDGHPIHLHLAQFQILNRQTINLLGQYMTAYNAANPVLPVPPATPLNVVDPTPYFGGSVPVARANYEGGWKDTLLCPPGVVTRLIVRWSRVGPAAVVPYGFQAWGGPGYVTHCHILSHEENQMMRPFQLVP